MELYHILKQDAVAEGKFEYTPEYVTEVRNITFEI